jgi:hypothetical protein
MKIVREEIDRDGPVVWVRCACGAELRERATVARVRCACGAEATMAALRAAREPVPDWA